MKIARRLRQGRAQSGRRKKPQAMKKATFPTPSPALLHPRPRFPYSEEAYNSDDAPKRRRKKLANGRKSGRASADTQSTAGGVVERDKELWREGVKAGLGPGKAIFIERPRPRGDGGIKYVPGRIHPNTMAFLGDLKANNEREWLKSQ